MSGTDVKAAKEAAKATGKAAKTAYEHFADCATQAAKDLGDSSKTSSEPDPCRLTDAAKEIQETTYEAFKEQLKLRMTQAGAGAEDVENWIESHGKEVWKKAQELRESEAAKAAAAKAAKVVHSIKVAFVSALAAFVAFAFGYQQYNTRTHGDAKSGLEANKARWQAQQEFQRQMEQFNAISNELQAPELPDVSRYEEPTDAVKAVMPPEVMPALPAPVALIAIQPIEITLTMPTEQGGQTKTITTTVGQLYFHGARETRTEIEKRAADPETKPYVYAFQEPGSCTRRDCMGGNGGMKTGGRWDGRQGPGGLHAEQH